MIVLCTFIVYVCTYDSDDNINNVGACDNDKKK